MKALRNILAFSGMLLMIASFVWMQLHQTKRVNRRPQRPRSAAPSAASGPFAVVILDPGHGGQDSGAMCGGLLEKDLTLDVARRIDRLLDSEGIATLMTRLGDTYVSLADRAAFANRMQKLHFCQHSFQRGQQASGQWSRDLLRRASNHFEFLPGFVAAFLVATAIQFAES